MKAVKQEMRKQIQVILNELSDTTIANHSALIAERLSNIPELVNAERVSVYLSMKKEVQTHQILEWLFQNKKRVFVPKITGKTSNDMVMPELYSLEELASLEKTKWGIPEFSVEQLSKRKDGISSVDSLIDVVLAPGVAFTKDGLRLGHGKGYYDCFLGKLEAARKENGLDPSYVIGLALDEQISKNVPVNEHDVPLNAIVTPTQVYLKPK